MNEYIVFTDIDECVEDPALCGGVDGDTLCINEPGTYRCDCPQGYRQNGGQCVSK